MEVMRYSGRNIQCRSARYGAARTVLSPTSRTAGKSPRNRWARTVRVVGDIVDAGTSTLWDVAEQRYLSSGAFFAAACCWTPIFSSAGIGRS